jgi:sterol desaturase/sphingolipid hydroxylase (fatty acid hydroxylase superfamily)
MFPPNSCSPSSRFQAGQAWEGPSKQVGVAAVTDAVTVFTEQLLERSLIDCLWLLGYAVFFGLIERISQAEPGQRLFRKGIVTDLLHSVLNPILALPFVALILVVVTTLAAGVHERCATVISVLPFWTQVLAAIFVGDVIGYWRHRLLHLKYGWPFHAVHHSTEQMDWLSNDRVDVGENIVTTAFSVVGLFCLGFSTEVALIQAFLRRSYGIFIHCNVPWSYGPLDYVFVSPRFHRWHHAADARAIDRNFATFFSCLDWVFGTYFMPRDEFPHRLGLVRETLPNNYAGQVTYPYKELGRLLWSQFRLSAKKPAAPVEP